MGTANTLTHIHRHALAHTHTHTHARAHKSWRRGGGKEGERRGKGGFDRHTFYKTRNYNINPGESRRDQEEEGGGAGLS